MPHPEFEAIRLRFQYRCAYCGVTEESTGGPLTIDHYRPLTKGGTDEPDNLIYACYKCNQYKHNFWPDDQHVLQAQRVLHPLVDVLSLHIRMNEQTGLLEPITLEGQFHITLLRLNRPQLVRHRTEQQLKRVFSEKQRLLERQIEEMQHTIAAQQQYIDALQMQLASLRSRRE